jgi:hypothetical protein
MRNIEEEATKAERREGHKVENVDRLTSWKVDKERELRLAGWKRIIEEKKGHEGGKARSGTKKNIEQ